MANEIPTSPALAEASPISLSELFSRDPERLGKAELEVIVATLRKQREHFARSEAEGKETKKATKPKAVASPKAASLVASLHSPGDMDI